MHIPVAGGQDSNARARAGPAQWRETLTDAVRRATALDALIGGALGARGPGGGSEGDGEGRSGTAYDVVCADNSLPGGALLVPTRPYDRLRRERPVSTPPQVGEEAGPASPAWHAPETTGFLQPLLVARRGPDPSGR
ncbi:hypothetical protein [Streptomyces sp. NBC_00525]|uniref:hypothetical protein n=1 Tax=Streptomyces sp. NBC_00525 TaxID=2903660 RepID=UPI002E81369E|nr:hypothetical protein [Streptomyces sp. NBC_00525]WUC93131.1 hypothetical protein OG710_05685 [Streptomyces sp. NBC_00525]